MDWGSCFTRRRAGPARSQSVGNHSHSAAAGGLGCEKIKEPLSLTVPVKDPREYIWTIDTLVYSDNLQTLLGRIWGSSPRDVYVVGHSSGSSAGTMFHFDGRGWSTTGFHFAEGGKIRGPVDLTDVYGFSSNDVWAVGEHIITNPNPPPYFLDSTLIIHYDGVQWEEVSLKKKRLLNVIWGGYADDIWTGGFFKTLYHYDGQKWQEFDLPRPKDETLTSSITEITGRRAGSIIC